MLRPYEAAWEMVYGTLQAGQTVSVKVDLFGLERFGLDLSIIAFHVGDVTGRKIIILDFGGD